MESVRADEGPAVAAAPSVGALETGRPGEPAVLFEGERARGLVLDRIKVWITEEQIDVAATQRLGSRADGALVSFVGTVREQSEGRRVAGLDYEAYPEMALGEMRRIAEEALRRFDVGSVTMVHRSGELKVGEVSVVVAVAAPHRGEAFDACEFCIDTLKQAVPIWKKERFEDGTSAWVNHP